MIRLQTLGSIRLRIDDDEEISAVMAQPKRLALLVYLALARPRGPQRRDTLLAMFWPELDQSRARHALSQSLHFLRRTLGQEVVSTRGAEDVAVDVSALRCDALEFEQALEHGDATRALDLYAGEFLPGFHLGDSPDFDRWLDAERAQLRKRAVEAAHRGAEQAVVEGHARVAVRWAARAVMLDPLNERAVRRLMRANDAAGDRAAALAQFRAFTARLRADLDAEPSPETHELARTIRARSEATTLSSGELPVRSSALQPSEQSSRPSASVTPRPQRLTWRTAGLAVLAASVMVIGGALAIGRSSAGAAPVVSIAVLPFAEMGGPQSDEHLGDELTEDLTTILSNIPGLKVAARTSAFAFKAKGIDVREIGRTLNVGHVLEGSVRRDGESIRITAQLIDAATGYHLWSEAFDRPSRDLFAVQEEIVRRVARLLELPVPIPARGP